VPLYAIPRLYVPEYVASLCLLQHIPTFSTKKNIVCLTSQLLREISENVSFSYLEAAILDAATEEILCNSSEKQEYPVIFILSSFKHWQLFCKKNYFT
jgi:hypothetical protein